MEGSSLDGRLSNNEASNELMIICLHLTSQLKRLQIWTCSKISIFHFTYDLSPYFLDCSVWTVLSCIYLFLFFYFFSLPINQSKNHTTPNTNLTTPYTLATASSILELQAECGRVQSHCHPPTKPFAYVVVNSHSKKGQETTHSKNKSLNADNCVFYTVCFLNPEWVQLLCL